MTALELRDALNRLNDSDQVVFSDSERGHLVVRSVIATSLDVKSDIPVIELSNKLPEAK